MTDAKMDTTTTQGWHKMPEDPPKTRGFYIVAVAVSSWKKIDKGDMLLWLYDGQEFEYGLPVAAWHEMPPAYVEEETEGDEDDPD